MKRAALVGVLAAFVALVLTAASSGADGGYNLTLQWAPEPITATSNVIFSGTLTDDGVGIGPLADGIVEVDVFDNAKCTYDYWSEHAWWAIGYTDVNGNYSFGPVLGSDLYYGSPGPFYVRAYGATMGTWVVQTPCTKLGTTTVASTPPPVPQVNSMFLCYSKSQVQPGVWTTDDGAKLIKQGYWKPTAVDGNMAGGTNLGKYNLQCNATPKGDGYVGSNGEWYGTEWASFAALSTGLYPH